jgi:hypothetical protein
MRRYPVRRSSVQRSHVRRPRMRRPRMRRPWWHRSRWHRSRMNRSRMNRSRMNRSRMRGPGVGWSSRRLLCMRRSSVCLLCVRGPARDRAAGNWAAGNGAAGNGAARDRATRWRRGWRAAPAVAVLVLGRPGGTVMTTRGTARCARTRRPEKAVRSRRHPPPVRQPAASAGPAAIRWCPVVHGPVRPVRKAAVRSPAVRNPRIRSPGVRSPGVRKAAVRTAGMRSGHLRRCAIRPGHVRRCAIRPGHVRRCAIRPGHVRSGGTAWPAARPRSVPPAIGITAIGIPAIRVTAVRVPGIGVPAVRVPAIGVAAAVLIPAIRVRAVLIPAVGVPRGTATRPRPLRSGVTGTAVRGHARREPARLARLSGLTRIGPPWLTGPRRTGRRLARTTRQLSVVVLVEVGRPAGPGRILILGGDGITLVRGVGTRAVATAIVLTSRQTVRVTAEADVATFHQMPPGPRCPAMTRDRCPYPLSVGRQKSPV